MSAPGSGPPRDPLGLWNRVAHALVRIVLRLFPDDIRGITRWEMEETFFDRIAAESGERSTASGFPLGLWNLLWSGAAERLESLAGHRLTAGLWDDVRFGARALARGPAFSVGAVVMLTLGIGATNAMFSMGTGMARIADRFEDPDELVFVWAQSREWRRASVTAGDFLAWRAQASAFEEMGAFRTVSRYVTGDGDPVRTDEIQVSSNLLPMIGIEAEIGRLPGVADEDPSAEAVAVLTWRFWEERFGADPATLGQTLLLDDVPHTIIGVLPREVEFESLWRGGGAFTPLSLDAGTVDWGERGYRVMARLADGASVEQAGIQITAIAVRLAEAHPETHGEVGAAVMPFRDYFFSPDDRLAVRSLILAVVAVLLIACVNLANLLLARGTARQGEVAIRIAVGAGRWQIVRRLLTESLILASLGGVGGIVVGLWGMDMMMSSLPNPPFLADEVGFDASLLFFTLLVSAGAALTFGFTPALLASRVSLGESMKEGSASSSGGRSRKRFRSGILVAQLALTVPLVLTCVVAYRHVRALGGVDFGLATDGLLTVQVDLPPFRYPDQAQRAEFYRLVREAVRRVPGVTAVGAGVDVPIGAGSRTQLGYVVVEGREGEEGEARGVGGYKAVTPGFFEALGVSLAGGRTFVERDGPNDGQVAVVNEAMARLYWPGEVAVGKRLLPDTVGARYLVGTNWGTQGPITVVGVVRDFGATFYGDPPNPTLYLPHAQQPAATMVLVVQSSGDPLTLIPSLRQAIERIDPGVPLSLLRTGDMLVDDWLRESRVIAATLGLLGILALGLAVIGLYGMVAYSVAQRTFELGVRMVLGADRGAIRFAVMRSFLILGGVGLVLGLGISAVAGLIMRSQLFMLRTPVLSTGAAIGGVLLAVVVVASYLPARRATSIEPVRALRCE